MDYLSKEQKHLIDELAQSIIRDLNEYFNYGEDFFEGYPFSEWVTEQERLLAEANKELRKRVKEETEVIKRSLIQMGMD